MDLHQRERTARSENLMANDSDWVADVKRWYLASASSAAAAVAVAGDAPLSDYGVDLGYEAAHPSLQARHWPDADGITTDR